ncbi:MAG: hypothetical protein V4625_11360 [Pseudomonadota bacterium]
MSIDITRFTSRHKYIAPPSQRQNGVAHAAQLQFFCPNSPVKTGVKHTENSRTLCFPEEDLPFSEVNLQHKDSKKVLFPYEMRFFSSSIRIAIGE